MGVDLCRVDARKRVADDLRRGVPADQGVPARRRGQDPLDKPCGPHRGESAQPSHDRLRLHCRHRTAPCGGVVRLGFREAKRDNRTVFERIARAHRGGHPTRRHARGALGGGGGHPRSDACRSACDAQCRRLHFGAGLFGPAAFRVPGARGPRGALQRRWLPRAVPPRRFRNLAAPAHRGVHRRFEESLRRQRRQRAPHRAGVRLRGRGSVRDALQRCGDACEERVPRERGRADGLSVVVRRARRPDASRDETRQRPLHEDGFRRRDEPAAHGHRTRGPRCCDACHDHGKQLRRGHHQRAGRAGPGLSRPPRVHGGAFGERHGRGTARVARAGRTAHHRPDDGSPAEGIRHPAKRRQRRDARFG